MGRIGIKLRLQCQNHLLNRHVRAARHDPEIWRYSPEFIVEFDSNHGDAIEGYRTPMLCVKPEEQEVGDCARARIATISVLGLVSPVVLYAKNAANIHSNL